MMASLLCMSALGLAETKHCQSVLQVIHHTTHTHGLLTKYGIAVFVEASTVTASAFLFKLVAYMLLHIAAGLPPALSIRAGTATQLIAGSFCAFSWFTGQLTAHLTSPPIPHIGSCLHVALTDHESAAPSPVVIGLQFALHVQQCVSVDML